MLLATASFRKLRFLMIAYNLQATIGQINQSMTYGTNVNGPALGSMALSGGPYNFKVNTGLTTTPAVAVIWVGAGGMMRSMLSSTSGPSLATSVK